MTLRRIALSAVRILAGIVLCFGILCGAAAAAANVITPDETDAPDATPVTAPAAPRAAPAAEITFGPSAETMRVMVAALVEATNREREAKHRPPLTLSINLSAAAQAHAEDMLARGYFAHESPEGEISTDRLARIAPRAIVLAVRENILKSEGEQDDAPAVRSVSVVDGWMGSPGHREKLLAEDVTHVGFGIASKMVKGRLTEVCVQVLGRLVGFWSAAPPGELHAPERLRARLDVPIDFFLEDTAHPERRYRDPNDASTSWKGGVPLLIVPDRGESIVKLPRVDSGRYRLLGRITPDDGYQAIREIRVVSLTIGG
jgi:uncharacterized protein YkwD